MNDFLPNVSWKNKLRKLVIFTPLAVICLLMGLSHGDELKPSDINKAVLANATSISADGVVRTTLQKHIDQYGNEFRLVLTTYPPNIGLPVHHHPTVAFNYILEGVAESQYEGGGVETFKAGDSFTDKANVKHLIFRNASKDHPLKYLIIYTTKRDESFLAIP